MAGLDRLVASLCWLNWPACLVAWAVSCAPRCGAYRGRSAWPLAGLAGWLADCLVGVGAGCDLHAQVGRLCEPLDASSD